MSNSSEHSMSSKSSTLASFSPDLALDPKSAGFFDPGKWITSIGMSCVASLCLSILGGQVLEWLFQIDTSGLQST